MIFFKRKQKLQADPLTVVTGIVYGLPEKVLLIRVSGQAPLGSEGNAIMEACFDRISQQIDIQSF